MAFVFLVVGVTFLVSGVLGTTSQLWTNLYNDFAPSAQPQGQHSFLVWFFAILVIGAIGYVKDLRSVSRWFLALVIIAMLLGGQQSGESNLTKLLNGINSFIRG